MKLAAFSLVAAAGIALSACATPTPQPTATLVPSATPVPATQVPTATITPSPEPTATDDPSAPVKVQITLVDNSIISSLTTFKAGTPYTFVIRSNARHEHNFVIGPPVALAGGYAEALSQALLAVDETQVPIGGSYSVDFTFPPTAVGATLEFSCLIKRHYEDGMRLDIAVTD